MKMRIIIIGLSLVHAVASVTVHASEADANASTTLWYERPATDWMKEALPIGNGRLGGMVFGGVENEHIQFNVDTLWVGDEEDTGSYQAFGDLFIDLDVAANDTPGNYRRELDIQKALHTISYEQDGTTYRREYFASHPANLMAAGQKVAGMRIHPPNRGVSISV